MLRQPELNKIKLEPPLFRPGLEIAESFNAVSLTEVILQNEIQALKRSNRELRELAASLRVRNEDLRAYAHTVAHALKNPLSVLIVIASAMAEIADLTPKELKEYREQIKITAYEMNGIVDNLMFLSEVNVKEQPAERLDMAEVVAKACSRLGSMIEEYRGNLLTPKTWPAAIGYAPWVEEVWANYISNALKYGGRSPRIELGADLQPDGMIRFWTRDEGPGIPVNKQAALFTPFTRVGKVRRPGNGLGLSIVHRIIEKLGGQVGVESKTGKGSLFYFTLPAYRVGSSPEKPAHLQQAALDRTVGQMAALQPA